MPVLTISAGTDPRYLTEQVAAGREGYYTDAVVTGEPPGVWWGSGAQQLGLEGVVDAELLSAVYSHGLDPRDPLARDRATWSTARRLGRPPRRYRRPAEIYAALISEYPDAGPETRERLRLEAAALARHPVTYEDVTYSVPKSLSVLWAGCEWRANRARALGDAEGETLWRVRASAIEEAVMAGARAALDYLQEQAGYARVGHHGGGAGRWLDAHQWVAAMFLQHDSRDRDPQVHVHCAVLNKQLCADGEWRALDTALLGVWLPAAAAISSRVTEAATMQDPRLGLRWETRADGVAREVVGVGEGVRDAFSQRRDAVVGAAAEAIREWERAHGRPAPNRVRSALTRACVVSTRPRKSHDGPTHPQRVREWAKRIRASIDQDFQGVTEAAVTGVPMGASLPELPDDLVERALERLQATSKTGRWTLAHAMLAVSDLLPPAVGETPELVAWLRAAAEQVVAAGVRLTPEDEPDLPAGLRLADGRSAYTRPGAIYYATPGTLRAERALREATTDVGAHTLDAQLVSAVAEEYARGGMPLGDDQLGVLRAITTTPHALQVLTAPAGAGKSTTLGALQRVYAKAGRRVLGLATTQIAAQILTDEGLPASNIARWLARAPGVSRGDVVVVDEASMTSTTDLDAIRRRCESVGATLLLVGDPRQLGPVEAGGVLGDLTQRAVTHSLRDVRRFTAPWEGLASLRLRDGHLDAVRAYTMRHRVHGAPTTEGAEVAAVRSWLADHLSGRDSLLITASNEDAAKLNARVRAMLVERGMVAEAGVLTRDGTIAGVGDVVMARRNAWDLTQRGVAPINRATYRVVGVREDGGLEVTTRTGARLTLPGEYVRDHLTLGYASTVHAAQGRTLDTTHSLLPAWVSRESLYVALTRGRHANHIYMVTGVGEDARDPSDLLVEILTRGADAPEPSALAYMDTEAEQARSALMLDRLTTEVLDRVRGETLAEVSAAQGAGVLTPEQAQALRADKHLPTLVWRAALRGGHPRELIRRALHERDWDGVGDAGAVLRARIREHTTPGPATLTSCVDLIPTVWRDEPRWVRLAGVGDARRAELTERVRETQPAWLHALGERPTGDPEAATEWERRVGWVALTREITTHADAEVPLPAVTHPEAPHHALLHTTAAADLPEPEGALDQARATQQQTHDAQPEPPYVGDELRLAHEREQRAHQRLWLERHTDRAKARREIGELRGRITQLERATEARETWCRETVTPTTYADAL